jgi:hypothetical protein
MNICNRCDKVVVGQGLCRKHYTIARKNGEISVIQKHIKQNPICSVDRCNLPTESKNLCKKHYSRLKKGNDIVKILDKSNWSDINLAWISGLIEGEGTFTIRKSNNKKYITIKVVSTDFDVIHKLHKLVGYGKINGPYDRSTAGKKRKPFLVWCLHDMYPQVELMNAILPYMCQRRSNRIKECLSLIENSKTRNLYI